MRFYCFNISECGLCFNISDAFYVGQHDTSNEPTNTVFLSILAMLALISLLYLSHGSDTLKER